MRECFFLSCLTKNVPKKKGMLHLFFVYLLTVCAKMFFIKLYLSQNEIYYNLLLRLSHKSFPTDVFNLDLVVS